MRKREAHQTESLSSKPLKMVKLGPFEASFSVDENIVEEYPDAASRPHPRKKETSVYVEATSGASFKVLCKVHKDYKFSARTDQLGFEPFVDGRGFATVPLLTTEDFLDGYDTVEIA